MHPVNQSLHNMVAPFRMFLISVSLQMSMNAPVGWLIATLMPNVQTLRGLLTALAIKGTQEME